MFTSYNEATASLEDRIAWALCQIIDDDAPMRWTRYRSAAVCIATNPEVMADLKALAARGMEGTFADKTGTFADPERMRAWEEAGRHIQAEDDGTAGVLASEQPRNVTAQEDKWLRDAANRSAKVVAPGKLAAGVPGTPAEFDRDTGGELLIGWSSGPGRMLTMSLRADGRLSYAFHWDGEKAHGTAQMPPGAEGKTNG